MPSERGFCELKFRIIVGYGATTLPAVTEALTIERNVTLAGREAARLALLLDTLAQKMMP